MLFYYNISINLVGSYFFCLFVCFIQIKLNYNIMEKNTKKGKKKRQTTKNVRFGYAQERFFEIFLLLLFL